MSRRLEPVQWAAIAGAIAVLVWSVPGIIINPDFATGDAATSKQVLGVDMNGWHALSGFLVALPAIALAFAPPRITAIYLLLASGSLIATAIWALESTHIAGGLFYFPRQETDAVLHFATSLIWLGGAAHYFLTEREPQPA